MNKANSARELVDSISKGVFTLDGSHLSVDFLLCDGQGLTSLKGVPKRIEGNLRCENNSLETLVGGPSYVGGYLDCHFNSLETLVGAPEFIGSYINCNTNNLTSLKGLPPEIKSSLFCRGNNINTLVDAPRIIQGDFVCCDNRLTTLQGTLEHVGGKYDCSNNPLVSLKGIPTIAQTVRCFKCNLITLEDAPKIINGDLVCYSNHIESLHNIHKHITKIWDKINLRDNPIKDSILGLLLIENLKHIEMDIDINDILNNYLGQGKTSLYKCAQELVKAGYPELAKL